MHDEQVKMAVFGTQHHASTKQAEDLLHHFAIKGIQNLAGFVAPKTSCEIQAVRVDEKSTYDLRVIQQFLRLIHHNLRMILRIWLIKVAEQNICLPREFIPSFIHQSLVDSAIVPKLFGDGFDWYLKVSGTAAPTYAQKVSVSIAPKNLHGDAANGLDKQWEFLPPSEHQHYLQMMESNLGEANVDFVTRVYQETRDDLTQFHAAKVLSLLQADIVAELIDDALNSTYFGYSKDTNQAVFDFNWSRVFADSPALRKHKGWIRNSSINLYHCLQCVPLDMLCEYWKSSPEALVEAAFRGENRELIFSVWQHRAISEKHSDFAEAILNFYVDRPELRNCINPHNLMYVVSFAFFQDYVDTILEHHSVDEQVMPNADLSWIW